MRRLALTLGMAVLVVSAMPVLSRAGTLTYTFQTVNYPGDTFTQLLGINNSDTIAGYHNSSVNVGFTLTLPSSFTLENYPGAFMTQVVGINNNPTPETVGFYVTPASINNGFMDVGGTFTTVDAPGTTFNQLLGVNDAGEVSGYSSTDPTGMTLQMAFTEKGGTFTYLNSSLPAGILDSQATDVNNSGWVSGFYVDGSGASHGFLLEGSTEITLNFPGATETSALGLNNTGYVDGFYMDAAGNTFGFIYNIATGTYQQISDPFAAEPGGTTVNGINNQDQLVGFYMDAAGNTDGFVATPTPEPAALLLIGTGLLGITLMLRKRRSEVK